jgi:hypothetical protein
MALPNPHVPGGASASGSGESGGHGSNGAGIPKADTAQDAVARVTPAPDAASDDRSGLDRAEELVDRLAERVSSLTSSWGRQVLRLTSRARESAQDFWADVQEYRESKRRSD